MSAANRHTTLTAAHDLVTNYRQIYTTTPTTIPGSSGMTNASTRAGPWTVEDDLKLQEARRKGMQWHQIQKSLFPKRTPSACRKHCLRLIENNAKALKEIEEANKIYALAREYVDLRQRMWQTLADRVGKEWSVVEEKCMSLGVKKLLEFAAFTVEPGQLPAHPVPGQNLSYPVPGQNFSYPVPGQNLSCPDYGSVSQADSFTGRVISTPDPVNESLQEYNASKAD